MEKVQVQVQCSTCQKWRSMPLGVAPRLGDSGRELAWRCEMHPTLTSCVVFEDLVEVESAQVLQQRAAKALAQAEREELHLATARGRFAHVVELPTISGRTLFVGGLPLHPSGKIVGESSTIEGSDKGSVRQLGQHAVAEEAALEAARYLAEYLSDFKVPSAILALRVQWVQRALRGRRAQRGEGVVGGLRAREG